MKLSIREQMALKLLQAEAVAVHQRLQVARQQVNAYRRALQRLSNEDVLRLAHRHPRVRARLSHAPLEASVSLARLLLELQKQEELALETVRRRYQRLRDLIERLMNPKEDPHLLLRRAKVHAKKPAVSRICADAAGFWGL